MMDHNTKRALAFVGGLLLVGLLLAYSVATTVMLIDHESRLTRIESNRFTSQDAYDLQRRILESVPPPIVREMLFNHERRIDSLAVITRTHVE